MRHNHPLHKNQYDEEEQELTKNALPMVEQYDTFTASNEEYRGLRATSEESETDRKAAGPVNRESVNHELNQKTLLESQEKYLNLFNSIDEGFCIIEMLFDNDGNPYDYRFLEANKAFEKQTGLTNAIGKTMKQLAPDHEQHWFDIYGKVAATGVPVRFENVAKAIGHYYEVYAFRTGDPAQNHVAVLFKDISEQKKLREQQAYLLKLSDMLRSLPDARDIEEQVTKLAIDYFDADRCYYCEVKDAVAIICRDAFRGSLPSVSGRYSLQDFPKFMTEMATVKPLVVNDVHTSELISEALRTHCLKLQLISFIASPVIKQGETVGIFCLVQSKPRVWTDIEVKLAWDSAERIWSAVERSHAEKAIRTSEENYRAIVNQTIAGVMKVDLDGNIIFNNSRFAQMLAYPPGSLLKMNTEDLIYKKDIEQDRKMFDRLKKEGRAYQIEKRLLRQDGSSIWVNNQVSPIFNQNGEPYAAVIVSIDISQQKAIEKHKDDFISVASHELRTPLASIKVYTDFLIELFEDEKNEYYGGLMKKLNIQVNKMIKLVAGLLDTGRISTEKLALREQEFDLNELIKETVADAQLTATRHKLLFEPGNISPVVADRQRIAQVITNLLANAVKYSPSANKVIITSERINGEVKVSVRDFGIGISEEAREKIFKRFNRGDAPGDIGGLGLGLYISIEIIKLHSGRMGVETPPAPKEGNGRAGSIVYFVLPCVPETAPAT